MTLAEAIELCEELADHSSACAGSHAKAIRVVLDELWRVRGDLEAAEIKAQRLSLDLADANAAAAWLQREPEAERGKHKDAAFNYTAPMEWATEVVPLGSPDGTTCDMVMRRRADGWIHEVPECDGKVTTHYFRRPVKQ